MTKLVTKSVTKWRGMRCVSGCGWEGSGQAVKIMGGIRRAAHEKNTGMENTKYYRNCKCRRTLDFTGHFKTFSVTGYPKWKKLFNSGFMGQKIQKSKK